MKHRKAFLAILTLAVISACGGQTTATPVPTATPTTLPPPTNIPTPTLTLVPLPVEEGQLLGLDGAQGEYVEVILPYEVHAEMVENGLVPIIVDEAEKEGGYVVGMVDETNGYCAVALPETISPSNAMVNGFDLKKNIASFSPEDELGKDDAIVERQIVFLVRQQKIGIIFHQFCQYCRLETILCY